MIKYLLLLLATALILPVTVNAKEPQFLFSADQEVGELDILTKIHKDKDVARDKWLNSPATRLELITFMFGQLFKDKLEEKRAYYENAIKVFFEFKPFSSMGTHFSYVSEQDVFVALIHFEGLGKPKKPLKEFCEFVIKDNWLGQWQIAFDQLYQNSVLLPFTRGIENDPQISKAIKLLSKNIVIMVLVSAVHGSEDKKGFPRDFYTLRAFKLPGDPQIYYAKHSFTKK